MDTRGYKYISKHEYFGKKINIGEIRRIIQEWPIMRHMYHSRHKKIHKKCNTGGGGIVRGRDRMVVGFTTNCAIGAYDH